MTGCYFCGSKLYWSSDWNYDEIHGEGEGLVSLWTCSGCGAEHQFSKRDDKEEQILNDTFKIDNREDN